MAKLSAITKFLDNELNIKNVKDMSLNGLQVSGQGEVKKIGFAVDACFDVFEKAKELNCDMVVVHHGILWDKVNPLTGPQYKRVKSIIEGNISLYAAHLPLDKHARYGNNIQLAGLFDLGNIKEFGEYHEEVVGFAGTLKKEMNLRDFSDMVEKKLNTKCSVLDFGKKNVRTVAIVSGGGSSAVHEAIEKGLDIFFTGESTHGKYHFAKEGKINLITAGHYATETLGLKALQKLLGQKFNIQTVFIDMPTGL